jgi:hypothetical protein
MMPDHMPVWAWILVTALGSSGFMAFAGRIADRWLARGHAVVRKADIGVELEKALAASPTIKVMGEKLNRDYAHMEHIDRELREFRLTQLRQCLFAHPYDQNSHQSAIESGEAYIALGGNGVGHKRLAQLEDNYAQRVAADDWDYTHNRP